MAIEAATRRLRAGPPTIEVALRGTAPAHALEGMIAAASPASGTGTSAAEAAAVEAAAVAGAAGPVGYAGPVARSAATVRNAAPVTGNTGAAAVAHATPVAQAAAVAHATPVADSAPVAKPRTACAIASAGAPLPRELLARRAVAVGHALPVPRVVLPA